MDTEIDTDAFPPVGPNAARALLYCAQARPEIANPALCYRRDGDGKWIVDAGDVDWMEPRTVIITRAQLVEFLATCGIPDDYQHLAIDTNMLVSIGLASRAENTAERIRSTPKAGSATPERLADIRWWAGQDFDLTDPLLPYRLLMMLREVLADFLPEDDEPGWIRLRRVNDHGVYKHPDGATVYEGYKEDGELSYTAAGGGGTLPGTYPTLRAAYDAVVAYRADPVAFLDRVKAEVEPDFRPSGSPGMYWYSSNGDHWQLMRGDIELGYVLHHGPLGTVPGGWRAFRCVEEQDLSEELVLGSYGTAEMAKDALWEEVARSEGIEV